jgi:hypothetical protein
VICRRAQRVGSYGGYSNFYRDFIQSGISEYILLIIIYECTDKYIKPKMVGPFPGSCTRESYVHRAALFIVYLCLRVSYL